MQQLYAVCEHSFYFRHHYMAENSHKIRIKDIAVLAGVSEGTVDRVLHKRGDVSAKSREAVTKVLEEMNYSPNLFARLLASKKNFRFVCFIPSYQPGEYWESVDKGFNQAAQEFLHHNVVIEKKYFNQFDNQSFVTVTEEILQDLPDGVILSPIFRNESISFIEKLEENETQFSFIDSLIEDMTYNTYYGQNSFQSGYIAAKMLLSSMSDDSQIVIIRTKRKGSVSNQTLSRNKGFFQFVNDNKLQDKVQIISVEFSSNDEAGNLEILRDVFENNQNIKALITFNSKVYRLAAQLDTLGKMNLRLIGYDLLDENVKYLKNGTINLLIAQRPDKQAYLSVRDMCRKLIFRQEINRINYVPIDILMKENIEDYLRFNENN